MSDTIEPVATTRGSKKQQREQDQALAAELVERARAEGGWSCSVRAVC